MLDPRITRLARNLVNYSVAAKKGDKVLIEATDVDTEMVTELVKAVYEVGAYPFVETYKGKVNAAVNALTLIEHFKPSVVINTGVAGGTGAARVGDVVVADRIAYHDVWCGPDTIHGQAAGCPRHFISTFSDNIFEGLHIRRGLVASGDIFVSKPSEVRHILDLYPDAVAVDMESAAIAHVCHLKQVSFLCVRVVSDTPGGEDNISQYENFWQDAPQHTFEVIDTVVARL